MNNIVKMYYSEFTLEINPKESGILFLGDRQSTLDLPQIMTDMEQITRDWTGKELFVSSKIQELIDDGGNKIHTLSLLCDINGFYLDTIGYSNWTYAIFPKSINKSYVNDIWEGWNFYDLALLNSEGEVIDSICTCYILDDESLKEHISDYFNINSFLLVDNEASKGFDFDKVKEIAHVRYSYERI